MMEDEEDMGLKGVMGDRYKDSTQDAQLKAAIISLFLAQSRQQEQAVSKSQDDSKEGQEREEPQEAKWEPVRGARTDLERLKDACEAMLPYAVACIALWVWQISGALDAAVGQTASTICAMLTTLAAAIGWYKEDR